VLICLQTPVSLSSCFCTSFSAAPLRIASLTLLLNAESRSNDLLSLPPVMGFFTWRLLDSSVGTIVLGGYKTQSKQFKTTCRVYFTQSVYLLNSIWIRGLSLSSLGQTNVLWACPRLINQLFNELILELIHELIVELINYLIAELKKEDTNPWFVNNDLHTTSRGQGIHKDSIQKIKPATHFL